MATRITNPNLEYLNPNDTNSKICFENPCLEFRICLELSVLDLVFDFILSSLANNRKLAFFHLAISRGHKINIYSARHFRIPGNMTIAIAVSLRTENQCPGKIIYSYCCISCKTLKMYRIVRGIAVRLEWNGCD